jgi:hypothetical protein
MTAGNEAFAEPAVARRAARSPIEFVREAPSLLLIAVLVIAAPVDIYLAYRALTSKMTSADLIAVLVIGAMIGLVVLALSQWRQGIAASFDATASPTQIRDEAARLFASSGWSLRGDASNEQWYGIERGAHIGLAVLLALFGMIPAIVYLLVARNEQVAHISWRESDSGLYRVSVGVTPRSPHGRTIIRWLHQRLNS